MSPKRYLLTIGLVALVGWGSFALVLNRLEPCISPGEVTLCHAIAPGGLTLFFLSLSCALLATFIVLGFAMRIWMNNYEIFKEHLAVSVRQGILLTLCTLGALILLLLNSLTWWSGLLLIALIMLIELYFSHEE